MKMKLYINYHPELPYNNREEFYGTYEEAKQKVDEYLLRCKEITFSNHGKHNRNRSNIHIEDEKMRTRYVREWTSWSYLHPSCEGYEAKDIIDFGCLGHYRPWKYEQPIFLF